MDLTYIENIEQLLKDYRIYPKKEKGQHFLINREALDIMVKATSIKSTDRVLEIGPGFGVLTKELAAKAKQVVTVELDRKLVKALRSTLPMAEVASPHGADKTEEEAAKSFLVQNKSGGLKPFATPNVTIIQGDILKLHHNILENHFANKEYKLVANLPYNITSRVLRDFLENEPRPKSITVMIQKEVAARVTAGPGKMSKLSVSVQIYGQPSLVAVVPPDSFWPPPEVDSAILHIELFSDQQRKKLLTPSPLLVPFAGAGEGWGEGEPVEEKKFFQTVRIGFSARRKQIHNNLASGFRISSNEAQELLVKAKLDPKIRAQDLSIADWVRLAKVL